MLREEIEVIDVVYLHSSLYTLSLGVTTFNFEN